MRRKRYLPINMSVLTRLTTLMLTRSFKPKLNVNSKKLSGMSSSSRVVNVFSAVWRITKMMTQLKSVKQFFTATEMILLSLGS